MLVRPMLLHRMALVSVRLFCKNLGNLQEFFGQMVYCPPWQKIARTPMTIFHSQRLSGHPFVCCQTCLPLRLVLTDQRGRHLCVALGVIKITCTVHMACTVPLIPIVMCFNTLE